MCPPGYYQSSNGLMVTYALGQVMCGYTLHIAVTNELQNAQQVKQRVLRSSYICRI